MATAHRRHQLSLTVFNHPPRKPPLTPEESQIARSLFKTLIDYARERTSRGRYKPAVLIDETFERIQCKDVFLEYFFTYIYTNVIPEEEERSGISQVFAYFRDFSLWSSENKDTAMDTIDNFAEYLIDNFFMPIRASSVKTPQQPTPAALSANQNAPAGTKSRVSRLRQECLKRDHYRCVVSRKFDRAEAKKRLEQNENSKDDDGELLRNQGSDQFEYLEVAHIIPHSLATISSEESELSESKRAALYILDMFDPDIGPLIAGPEIDSPYNALTLTLNYHRLFGEFEIYFEQKDPSIDRTYIIDSTEQWPFLRDPLFPVTRELHLSPELTIDPPASKLLKVHCAIAHILKLSGAGEYIERTLREMTETCVSADGSTDLGRLVRSRLGNWSNVQY